MHAMTPVSGSGGPDHVVSIGGKAEWKSQGNVRPTR